MEGLEIGTGVGLVLVEGLEGTSLDADAGSLRGLYIGRVGPVLECGIQCGAWQFGPSPAGRIRFRAMQCVLTGTMRSALV